VTRILVYTGKGGVGKTSVAAATALMSARRGSRTIVLSTDIAHSLADAFGVRLGPEPSEVAPNLWGQEPDVYFNIGRYWRTIQAYMAELFSWRGLDAVMAEEMTVLPGMDELGNLLWIADHVESGKYDVIVVDAAPTGETLRLLSLPEASRWWLDRIAPIGRRVSRISRPVLERMIGVPIPRDEVFAAAERLLKRLEQVHRLLADPDRSSVRIVLGLEKLAIAEAQRSFTYFHLFGYPSDLVVCNRVLPPDVGGYFTGLRKAQQAYLPEVERQFAPVPVRTVPFFDREMLGIEGLGRMGMTLTTTVLGAAPLVAVAAAGSGAFLTLLQTSLQQSVPRTHVGRVLGLVWTVAGWCTIAGMLLFSGLAKLQPVQRVLQESALLCLLLAMGCVLLLRRQADPALESQTNENSLRSS